QHALTEMINNAIDHSGSEHVRVGLRRNALFVEAWVEDDGEGIFVKIQRALGLYDPRESMLELAKGKLTTSPQNHSGEGIFFTSRMVDAFEIRSGDLVFAHAQHKTDSLTTGGEAVKGTQVRMRLANDSERTAGSIFDEYSESEDYTFDKTVVPVRLAQHGGEQLVSRSQAKRVAHRFERFKRVVLDFTGVDEIGQAFADELFRVFASAHPEIQLTPMNTSPAVASMVRRALSAKGAR
ncbi:MAG: STAS-like domain-containing protein, partial [Steroidobacteraceae bacterium]